MLWHPVLSQQIADLDSGVLRKRSLNLSETKIQEDYVPSSMKVLRSFPL